MKEELSKEQCIQKAYEHLVKRLCAEPPTKTEQKNLREWAEAFAGIDSDADYYAEGISPEDAVEEEFSCY